jgi:hypothetical protein
MGKGSPCVVRLPSTFIPCDSCILIDLCRIDHAREVLARTGDTWIAGRVSRTALGEEEEAYVILRGKEEGGTSIVDAESTSFPLLLSGGGCSCLWARYVEEGDGALIETIGLLRRGA